MEKSRKPIPWLSGGLATLVALFIVAATLPSTDRAVIDNSVSPPQTHIEPQPVLVLAILVIVFLPVLCIFTLGRRRNLLNWLAWGFLAFLLVSVMLG